MSVTLMKETVAQHCYYHQPRRRLERKCCFREALTVTIVLWTMGAWSLVWRADRRHLQWSGTIETTTMTMTTTNTLTFPRLRQQQLQQIQKQSFKLRVPTVESTTHRTAFPTAKDTRRPRSKNRNASTPNDIHKSDNSINRTGSGSGSNDAHHRESRLRGTQRPVKGDEPEDWPPIQLLEALLESSLPPHDRRLVVAASTLDMVDVCDNFAASLLAVNVSNFVLIPLDSAAHTLLMAAYPQHTVPVPPQHVLPLPAYTGQPSQNRTGYGSHDLLLLPAAAHFGSAAFQTLTATRPKMLRPFLEKGYTILYNDIDMVWRKNAWDVIDARRNADHQPIRNEPTTGNATNLLVWQDGRGQLCTCLLYLTPTATTLTLLTQWNDEMEHRGPGRQHRKGTYDTDQTAFITVAKRWQWPMAGGSVASMGVTIFPSDAEFPPGKSYGWNATKRRQHLINAKAVIVHNNWIFGKQAKVERFQTAGLWKPSGRLVPPEFVVSPL